VKPEEHWREAFATQAYSDLEVHEKLCACKPPVPVCHRAHYLQMHLEKICKAYLWGQSLISNGLPEFHRNHNVIAKTMPIIARQYWRMIGEGRPSQRVIGEIRSICREIDLLAPAVDDDGRRPDNCEYPWWSPPTGAMEIPVRSDFPVYGRLNTTHGRNILKIARYLCDQHRQR
jgi:hypothetical protein